MLAGPTDMVDKLSDKLGAKEDCTNFNTLPQLGFKIGDRVECNCGEWKAGTIVALFYKQASFGEGNCVPYQVKLDDGSKLIYAPTDDDKVIRAYSSMLQSGDHAEMEEFQDEDIPDHQKLPVTVVTGFLGAGKTTLVNYILNEHHGKKICVIENEFGEVNIDSSLVQDNMQLAEEIIGLENGCACCTVRGDLLKALKKLKDRKNDFDFVLLETTGLANPAPVVGTFTQDATIFNHFRVDGIVTMVDCKFIKQHLDEVKAEDAVNEAVCQVAFADRILLNKTDLVTKDELQTVKETIRSINSFAELVETEHSRVPMDKIMNLSAFSIERMKDGLDEFVDDEEDVCTDPDCTHDHAHADVRVEHAHGHAEEHGHSDKAQESAHDEQPEARAELCSPASTLEHSHVEKKVKKKRKHDLSKVGSTGLTIDKPLDSQMFNSFMSELLQTKSKDLYRSKGMLCFEGEGDKKFIFQGVHEQIQYTEAQVPWQKDEPRVSKVVFIGRELDFPKLKEKFEACAIDPNRPKSKSFFGLF